MSEAEITTAAPETTTAEITATQPETIPEASAEVTAEIGGEAPAGDATVEGGEKPAETEKPEPAKEVEYTDFTAPEGEEITPETADWLKALGKEHNLPQEALQKILDKGFETQQASLQQFEAMKQEWQRDMANDETLGGPHLKENLAKANQVCRDFFSEDFMKVAKDFGIVYRKEFLQGLVKLADATQDPTIQDSAQGGGAKDQPKDMGAIMYPHMPQAGAV